MRLYHRTAADTAAAILAGGFRDAAGRYMTDREHSGVWLSDRPLDANEGAAGDALLAVDWPAHAPSLAEYEWVEEGKAFREFLVPAALVNDYGVVGVLETDAPIPQWGRG